VKFHWWYLIIAAAVLYYFFQDELAALSNDAAWIFALAPLALLVML
jgi:hypothetical protein